jgi:Leucine-rich repeat (LRR) protein
MELTIEEGSSHEECMAAIATAIASGKKITVLNCSFTDIESIPSDGLLFVEEVDCSGCGHLTEISELPALKRLYCGDCAQLTNIDKLKNSPIEILQFEYTHISHLPILPCLTGLTCHHSNFKAFDSLRHSPNLVYLAYRDNTLGEDEHDLPDLPDLPNLQFLNYNVATLEKHRERIRTRNGLFIFELARHTDQLGVLSDHGIFLTPLLKSYLMRENKPKTIQH